MNNLNLWNPLDWGEIMVSFPFLSPNKYNIKPINPPITHIQ